MADDRDLFLTGWTDKKESGDSAVPHMKVRVGVHIRRLLRRVASIFSPR